MSEANDREDWLLGGLNVPLTRRELIRRAGQGSLYAAMAVLLAGCGVQGEQQPRRRTAAPSPLPAKAGELRIANWPLYIDQTDGGDSPTVQQFEKQSGIDVTYKEVIEDNETFFGTIREPLANGQPIEWDIIVVTDWLIGKMARLGYLEELHLDRIPNFTANAAQIHKNPSYDPGNRHSIPWQSGITGIGYNPELTGRKITSFEDLFDPAFKGKVGMMTEMRDTMNLTLLGLGIDPQIATLEDAEKAQQKLLQQRDAGIVRAYYGNEYADALAKGDLALSMAWSGDVFILQADNPELEFVVPEEGGILWTDNMAIPRGAEHPTDAHEWMNFVYEPEIAAQIAEYVWYITPVPATKDIILEHAEETGDEELKAVATSPLVFPTPEMESRLVHYKVLDEEEEEAWNDLFQQVTQG